MTAAKKQTVSYQDLEENVDGSPGIVLNILTNMDDTDRKTLGEEKVSRLEKEAYEKIDLTIKNITILSEPEDCSADNDKRGQTIVVNLKNATEISFNQQENFYDSTNSQKEEKGNESKIQTEVVSSGDHKDNSANVFINEQIKEEEKSIVDLYARLGEDPKILLNELREMLHSEAGLDVSLLYRYKAAGELMDDKRALEECEYIENCLKNQIGRNFGEVIHFEEGDKINLGIIDRVSLADKNTRKNIEKTGAQVTIDIDQILEARYSVGKIVTCKRENKIVSGIVIGHTENGMTIKNEKGEKTNIEFSEKPTVITNEQIKNIQETLKEDKDKDYSYKTKKKKMEAPEEEVSV